MRTTKKLQVRARKPADKKFGDFMLTDVDLDGNCATAVFDDNTSTSVDISPMADKLSSYSKRNKRFYIRLA